MEAVIAVGATALLALWWTVNRRELRRRDRRSADWDGAEGAPRLWTSAARCPGCGSSHGLLSQDVDQLWLSCLACGQRHPRETKA